MQKEKVEEKEIEQVEENQTEQTHADVEESSENENSEASEEVPELSEIDQLRADVSESKDKYLRLYSEFENFRRRTAKERLELISSASKDLMESLIPVMDDFERAINAMETKEDPAREGTELIYNKFKKVLESKGVRKMDVNKGDDFNDDFHEAITQIPSGPELAGKVVDVVEKGYFLGEKVVRFAKVVTGANS
ncbi:MAG: molecular chaperone GrpE [Marinoscillum sp.]|jgi:molecular chaperone GrpE